MMIWCNDNIVFASISKCTHYLSFAPRIKRNDTKSSHFISNFWAIISILESWWCCPSNRWHCTVFNADCIISKLICTINRMVYTNYVYKFILKSSQQQQHTYQNEVISIVGTFRRILLIELWSLSLRARVLQHLSNLIDKLRRTFFTSRCRYFNEKLLT